MLKSQLISVCFVWGLALPAVAASSVLLPFSNAVTLEQIEQTDLYAKADDGYADAQFQLACFYQKQKKKDYQTIVMWLTKSANQGYLEAQFALGRIYQYGKPGVLPDPELSEKYYEMAAEKGDKDALRALAYLRRSPSYKIKSAPDIDEKWDMQWLAKTAGYGDSISQYELGRLFEEGSKVPRNYEKALYWYERAANQNRLEAMCAAAYMYLDGNHRDLNIPITDMKFHHNLELYKQCVKKFNIGNGELRLPLICMGDRYIMGWKQEDGARFEEYLKEFQKKTTDKRHSALSDMVDKNADDAAPKLKEPIVSSVEPSPAPEDQPAGEISDVERTLEKLKGSEPVEPAAVKFEDPAE